MGTKKLHVLIDPSKSNHNKQKQTRRGKRAKQLITEKLTITGTNANGLATKKESLLHSLQTENPQVFMVQETKLRRKNQIKVDGYQLFERVRKGKSGGGIMIGIRNDIESIPVIVSDYDEVEILVVEVTLKSMVIRFLTAYGPQEGAPVEIINLFYSTLEAEILKCEEHNCGLIAEMDCNAKLGNQLIPGDPNAMSTNGKFLWDIIERRCCIVVNATDKCNGTITRSRLKGGKKEESVLDYVVVNPLIFPYVEQMMVDETKDKALTRFTKGKAVPSDHNMVSCIFDIPIKRQTTPRTEIYRLRNEEELQQFKENTTNTKRFTNCFVSEGDVNDQGHKWMKLLQKTISRSFKKIRIRPNHNSSNAIQNKMKERMELQKKIRNAQTAKEKHKLEDDLTLIEHSLTEEQKLKQKSRVEQHLGEITDTEGRVNTGGVWRLRRKICPKPQDQLSAKKDKRQHCN